VSGSRPPRVARAVLRRCLPGDSREAVLGDLEEVYHQRRRAHGRLRAGLWYRLQATSFALRFTLEQIREAAAGVNTSAAPSWLDFKLGTRMLVKSPLLTLTGCVAIATAIGINAGFNEFIGDMTSVATELQEDHRIVRLANIDVESGGTDPRLLGDLVRWRDGLETVEDIGAALRLDMGLVLPDGQPRPVDVAEMSASGFRIAGMVPELGRPFLDTDDGPGAEPVMIIGYDWWRHYLGGDPEIIGSALRLGETSYRVLGVAPPGFRFPGAVEIWVNFRRDPAAYQPRAGPGIIVFGRLADGRTLDDARLEIERLGVRAASDSPETHARLRPSVTSFGDSLGLNGDAIRWALRIFRTLLVLLLIVACANIATLVFARNVGRESEIAVRSALGAGRSRIVMQLFAEATVLAVVSAGIGLAVADWGLKYGGDVFWEVQRTDPPLWWDPGMSLSTVLYSLGLAVLGAGVVGILPALRATGRRAQVTLQRLGSGGSRLSFGATPTAVIVVQMAIAVALIPIMLEGTLTNYRAGRFSITVPSDGYLTARLLVDSEVEIASTAADQAVGARGRVIQVAGVTDNFRTGPALLARYREMREIVGARIRNEPGVRSVAFTSRLPGLLGQSIPATRLEVEGRPNEQGWYTRTTTAELEFFDLAGRSMSAGRTFTMADYAPEQRVAIVNETLVREVFFGESPVGHLVREHDPEGDEGRPWTQIVGVVTDEVVGAGVGARQIYYPLAGVGEYPMRMLIEVDGDPAAFAPRLRALTADAAPGLIMDEVLTLEEIRRGEVLSELFFVVILGFVALVTALLATAGVYALMSFIVSQRTREIGIRTALGAEPTRVVRGVFLRTFVQLGLGVVVGLAIVGALGSNVLGYEGGSARWVSGVGVATLLLTVGLVGCAIPVVRALRIQPTQALRAEG
jgi:putative ABC transport system permease protein